MQASSYLVLPIGCLKKSLVNARHKLSYSLCKVQQHCDAVKAKAAAVVTHVQSLSQEVGSGDEGLGLFGFDLSSAETDFW